MGEEVSYEEAAGRLKGFTAHDYASTVECWYWYLHGVNRDFIVVRERLDFDRSSKFSFTCDFGAGYYILIDCDGGKLTIEVPLHGDFKLLEYMRRSVRFFNVVGRCNDLMQLVMGRVESSTLEFITSYLKEFFSIVGEVYSFRDERDKVAFCEECGFKVKREEIIITEKDVVDGYFYFLSDTPTIINGILFNCIGDEPKYVLFLNNLNWVGEDLHCSRLSSDVVYVDVEADEYAIFKHLMMNMRYDVGRDGRFYFYSLSLLSPSKRVIMYIMEKTEYSFDKVNTLSIPRACVDELIDYLREWYRRYCEAYLYPLASAYKLAFNVDLKYHIDRCGSLLFDTLRRELMGRRV